MSIKSLIPILVSMMLTGACLFGASGGVDWWNAWVLLALSLLSGLAMTLGRGAELNEERRNARPDKSWDKALTGFSVLLGPMAMWITAGLDRRFGWNAKSPALSTVVASAAVAALGSALIVWAMRVNRFFSTAVRIQRERAHTVVDQGPYALVRHPGYAGMAAFTLATPFVLGSHWALIPAALTVLAIVARTALEDRFLRAELPGYADYALRVRSKLMPALW